VRVCVCVRACVHVCVCVCVCVCVLTFEIQMLTAFQTEWITPSFSLEKPVLGAIAKSKYSVLHHSSHLSHFK